MELKNCFLNLFNGKPNFIFAHGGEAPKPAQPTPDREPFRKGETARQTVDRLAGEKKAQEALNAPKDKDDKKPATEVAKKAEGVFKKGETAMQTVDRLAYEKGAQDRIRDGKKIDMALARNLFATVKNETMNYMTNDQWADLQNYAVSKGIMTEGEFSIASLDRGNKANNETFAKALARKAVEKAYGDQGANVARLAQGSYEAQQRRKAEEADEIPLVPVTPPKAPDLVAKKQDQNG